MNMDMKMPSSLKWVAWLFIIFGLSGLMNMLISLNTHHIWLSLGAIKLYVGIRLFMRSKPSRKAAIFLVCLDFILIPIVLVILLNTDQSQIVFRLFGYIGKIPTMGAFLLGIISLIINLWIYRVLYSKKTMRFFARGE
jgi:hypothetical protein